MTRFEPDELVRAPGPWTHREVAANGARFHVAEAGSGPLVLLLHGFPTFWWLWHDQLPLLADHGYRAVAMDLRGYGGSDHTPRGYDPFTLSSDVAGVIRSLGEPGAIIVGHGWGGLLAWTAASLHPDVVRGICPVSAPHPNRLRTAILHDRGQLAAQMHVVGFQRPWVPERKLVAGDAAEIARLLTAWSATPDWPAPDDLDRYRAAFQIANTAHCAVEYDRWSMRSLARADGRRFTAAMAAAPVACPVLQVHGAQDQTVLPRSANGSRQFVTGPYAWRLMDGVGHFPPAEAPGEFSRLLLAWLAAEGTWNDDPQQEQPAGD